MVRELLRPQLPFILNWIRQATAASEPKAKVVADLGFERLPEYFSNNLLRSAKVVPVEKVPVPPLSRLGLSQFADFENADFNGITYFDTFFIKEKMSGDERLHFHELIHVIQWRLLGPEEFLLAYAEALDTFGYDDNPYEVMAHQADQLFQSSTIPFDAESLVREALAILRR